MLSLRQMRRTFSASQVRTERAMRAARRAISGRDNAHDIALAVIRRMLPAATEPEAQHLAYCATAGDACPGYL